MAGAAEARNHHWIPQCYLKGFTRSGKALGQLYVVDAKQRKAFTTKPRNVAAERDFNRIDAPGLDPNQVETDMAAFESELALALERLIQHCQFQSHDDFHLILQLAAILATRSPERREQVRQFTEQIAKQILKYSVATEDHYEKQYGEALAATAPNDHKAVSYEALKDFIHSDDYLVNMSKNFHVGTELKTADNILPYFEARKWTLFLAPPDCSGYVTTDRPVVLRWAEEKNRGFFSSPGFSLKGTEVWFPISSRLALVGGFDDITGITELPQDGVALFNGVMIQHSGGRVYAMDDQFQYINLIGEQRRGTDMLEDIARFSEAHHG
jgi:hypothetical protein